MAVVGVYFWYCHGGVFGEVRIRQSEPILVADLTEEWYTRRLRVARCCAMLYFCSFQVVFVFFDKAVVPRLRSWGELRVLNRALLT